MITEDYVSFEIAKLLKDKGFDEPCYAYWSEDENRVIISQSMHALQNITNPCFFGPSAPTIQMVRKWLEETKEHLVYSYPVYDGSKIEWRYNIWFDNSEMFLGQILEFGTNETFNTYEEACEAAIKYCLEKLI